MLHICGKQHFTQQATKILIHFRSLAMFVYWRKNGRRCWKECSEGSEKNFLQNVGFRLGLNTAKFGVVQINNIKMSV